MFALWLRLRGIRGELGAESCINGLWGILADLGRVMSSIGVFSSDTLRSEKDEHDEGHSNAVKTCDDKT